jgi:isohexenylglutaconyl-CoA hydratase
MSHSSDATAPPIEVEHSGDWVTVWLNRPRSRNALSAEMSRALMELFVRVAPDRSIRGLTLRGRGGTFCAGADLKSFSALASGDASQHADAVATNLEGGRLFERLNTLPQVVVVLVEGATLAGGLGMACCADVVVVTRDAQFALTETTLGFPPAQIAPIVAARLGLPVARRLMLTAARFSGDEAASIGLADFVVDDSSGLDAIELGIRAQVRRCAPGANAATKEILLAARSMHGEALRQFAAESFARCLVGPEAREGLQSFVEKRKPSWAVGPDESQA